ncbi:MAG: M20 family metallo-hydrolase [Desulfitobacteriaceae bacterium]
MEPVLFKINSLRLQETLAVSSKIGGLPSGGLCRLALSDEDKAMRDLFVRWLKESELKVRIDDFGNIYGRREGKNAEASAVLVGSHLDTQPQGGRFDGVVGVLAAMEVIRTLNDLKIETERPIEIVSFTNEEGARFEPPMLGSGGITGNYGKEFVLSRLDRDGKVFIEELKRIGYEGSELNRAKNIYRYIELHVEQGPVLEQEETSIGAVEGIQGITWLEVKLSGMSGHAGATPMSMRRDALVAAAKMIVAIEQSAKEIDNTSKITVGRLSTSPNVVNCISSQVEFSIDFRHSDDVVRKRVIELVREKISMVAAVEGVDIKISDLWEAKTTHFSQEVLAQIFNGAKAYGYSIRSMMSGIGHDSKHLNDVAPTAMIFVPSVGGRSHCPEEMTTIEDIERGANVLFQLVHALAQEKEA